MNFVGYLSSPWVYWTLTSTYVLSIITVIGVVIGENRNPLKSLAWVTVLLLLPAVGLVLYLFFGRSIKNRRMISRRNKRRLRRREQFNGGARELEKLSDNNRQLARLARSLGAAYYPGNSLEIYNTGSEKFAALKRDLLSARQFIHLQYYIFEDDTIGKEIADILMERARAGVAVRVIYDHVGSLHVKNRFFKTMRQAGVDIQPFFKVTFPMLSSRLNWRNHRKIVVIDGKVGYIGGMNIADRYITGAPKFESWRDVHVRLTGPAVVSLQYSFAVDWNFMGQPLLEEQCDKQYSVSADTAAGIQTLTSGPMDRWHNMALLFHRTICGARKHVYLQTPYFLPTESLLKALQNAALSGVDVRVMIPHRSDSMMLVYASRSYITECLQAGVKFYFYEAGMLHSKVLIIDDNFSTLGSTNFDYRSVEHNFEANMLVYSEDVNARLQKIFLDDQKNSTRIRPAQWRKRSLAHKAFESILRLLSPIL